LSYIISVAFRKIFCMSMQEAHTFWITQTIQSPGLQIFHYECFILLCHFCPPEFLLLGLDIEKSNPLNASSDTDTHARVHVYLRYFYNPAEDGTITNASMTTAFIQLTATRAFFYECHLVWTDLFSKENCNCHFLVLMFHNSENTLWTAYSSYKLKHTESLYSLINQQCQLGKAQSPQWLHYKLNDCGLCPGKCTFFSFHHHMQIE
jgi:hypothetical protein